MLCPQGYQVLLAVRLQNDRVLEGLLSQEGFSTRSIHI